MAGILFALGVLAFCALAVVLAFAAWARFVDPEHWRLQGRWAPRPRLTLAIERIAFVGLNPLRALMLWLVLTGLVLAFLGVPALVYLLGRL